MASIHSEGPDEAILAPISLYFSFEPNEPPQLEAVAEAAIAWARAIRAMMAVVEPGIALKIELADAEEGSLWLTAVLRMTESAMERVARGASAYPRLTALAAGLSIIIVASAVDYTVSELMDLLFGDEAEASTLSESERELLAEDLYDVIEDRIAESEREAFARAIFRSPEIRAVGVAKSPTSGTRVTVTRQQIQGYVEQTKVTVEVVRRRRVTREVILVSPVLEDAERSWRFREPGMPEFGAVMKDKAFLSSVARGAVHEELRFGIPMVIEIEFKEVEQAGEWVTSERSVVRVIEPAVDRGELPFDPAR